MTSPPHLYIKEVVLWVWSKEWKASDLVAKEDWRKRPNLKETILTMKMERTPQAIWARFHRRPTRNPWLQSSNPRMCAPISWPWSLCVPNKSGIPKKFLATRSQFWKLSIQMVTQILGRMSSESLWYSLVTNLEVMDIRWRFKLITLSDSIIIFNVILITNWHN